MTKSKPSSQPHEFTNEQIHRTLRLARRHAFPVFDSGRAANATYTDSQIFAIQTYATMTNSTVAQGAQRYASHMGSDNTPHHDTHLRTVKQFPQDEVLNSFEESIEQLLELLPSEVLQRPVTVALDITSLPYLATPESVPWVSGTIDDRWPYEYKFATLSIVGRNVPLLLAVEPVVESSSWDQNVSLKKHRVVRRLLRQARKYVDIDLLLCDREFDGRQIRQTIDNYGIDYLMPKRAGARIRRTVDELAEQGIEIAVEPGVDRDWNGSHAFNHLYVPASSKIESERKTVAFVTNRSGDVTNAKSFCGRYRHRWHIENQYKSIKGNFLAKTVSKDYRVRLFYFVFGCLLYNLWRMTDLVLKVNANLDFVVAPQLRAGIFADILAFMRHPD